LNVRPQTLRILAVAWGLKGLVQREGHIAGNCEVVERSIDQSLEEKRSVIDLPNYGRRSYLLGFAGVHCRLHLPEALADEQGSINEHAVGRAVNLEVSEQDIGAKQRQDLVDAVVGLAVCGNVDVGGIWGESRQGVSGATGASAERQNWEVSYD